MLISSRTVVERMVTGCGGELRAPVVKQWSFELERYLGRYLQAGHKWREMNNPSLHWGGKSSGGFEFRLESGLAVQVFCIESCNKHLKTPQK